MKKQKNNYHYMLKKTGIAVLSVSVVTAGVVGLVSAYQKGTEYTPAENEREIQENQVVFQDDDQTVGQKKDEKNHTESQLLEKDGEGEEAAGEKNNADYFFENGSSLVPGDLPSVAVAGDTDSALFPQQENSDYIYDITDNPADADVILGEEADDRDLIAGGREENTSGSDQNAGSSADGSEKNEDTEIKNDTEVKEDDNKEPSIEEPDTPAVRPAATVKDPETEKTNPSDSWITSKPYTEGVKPSKEPDDSGDSSSVAILQSMEYDAPKLYLGQTVDERTIYNSLSTFVMGSDGVRYLWGSEALGKYIRITRVSFDGGSTWNSEFPVTIPEDLGDDEILIRAEYRLSESDTDWIARTVEYIPEKTRVFVLSREITEEDTNIDPSIILNGDQYPAVGSMINLLQMQDRLLDSSKQLTELFPGWMEDGTDVVPWFYPVTSGRHILEPAATVPLSPDYTVELKWVWMSEDYKVDGMLYDNLCYLQALTDMNCESKAGFEAGMLHVMWSGDTLIVPKYVQAVMINKDADINVDYLEIPDTVLYIDTENSGMRVSEGYRVNGENPRYAATDDGLLTDREETEILGIPYHKKAIVVPDTVKTVHIDRNNQLREIRVEGLAEDGEIPQITYRNLKNCRIVVPDEMLESILQENEDDFSEKSGNTIVAESDESTAYYVTDGMIVTTSGKLKKVLSSGRRSVNIPEGVTSILEEAFTEVPGATQIILSPDAAGLTLEQDSFTGSNIERILCFNERQYREIADELEEKAISDVSAELVRETKDGYCYSMRYENGEEQEILLLAPENAESFDGISAEDGTPIAITEIAGGAFASCEKLRWVSVPESVSYIGENAFKDCTSLQGILIRNREQIEIGKNAFEGCSALRFVASNAEYGVFLDGYDPVVTDSRKNNFFYVPSGAWGYSSNCVSFTEESGVYDYVMYPDGEDGWILYGEDVNGAPWILLRTGDTVTDQVELAESTREIFCYAFADTRTENGGSYTVNFTDTDTWAIDEGAFENSMIGDKIVLNPDTYIFSYAFGSCGQITSVEILPATDEETGRNGTRLYNSAFSSCEQLKTLTIGATEENGYLETGCLNGCSLVTDIYINQERPLAAQLFGRVGSDSSSSGFLFNTMWSEEEEMAQVKVHVPEGSEAAYAEAWRYAFAGYADQKDVWSGSVSSPAYMEMWNAIYAANTDWSTWEAPSDELVDRLLKEKLTDAENRVRRMIGAQTVAEPTAFYPYHVDFGIVRLAGIPSDTEILDLNDTVTMGLPENWYFDGIEPGAFAGHKNLKKVIFPYNYSELQSGVFEGLESDSLTLEFTHWLGLGDRLDLVLDGEGIPFSFGVDDSVIHLVVPEGFEETYIEQWSYKLAGYDGLEGMRSAVKEELSADGNEASEEEVDAVISERLLPQVNRLRHMMNLEEVDKIDADAFGLLLSEEETGSEGEKEEQELPENTDSEIIEEEKKEDITESTVENTEDNVENNTAVNTQEQSTSGTEQLYGSGEETEE